MYPICIIIETPYMWKWPLRDIFVQINAENIKWGTYSDCPDNKVSHLQEQTNNSIVFSWQERHKNGKFSHSHKAELCPHLPASTWFRPSDWWNHRPPWLRGGDVTGHIMQPWRLQHINGHAGSPRWSPSLPGWSTLARKSVKGHLEHHL